MCFGIGGDGGIVVVLMLAAAVRDIVVISSNLIKGDGCDGLLTRICQTRVILKQII